jgi:hypothetical protein
MVGVLLFGLGPGLGLRLVLEQLSRVLVQPALDFRSLFRVLLELEKSVIVSNTKTGN